MNTQTQIAEGAKLNGKFALALKDAGFRPVDAFRVRWTDGVSTFRLVRGITCGANGLNRDTFTLRQVWA